MMRLSVRTTEVKFTFTASTPGTVITAAIQASSIWPRRGQAGVVSTTVKPTLPPLMVISFTMSKVIRSWCSSGSITVLRA